MTGFTAETAATFAQQIAEEMREQIAIRDAAHRKANALLKIIDGYITMFPELEHLRPEPIPSIPRAAPPRARRVRSKS